MKSLDTTRPTRDQRTADPDIVLNGIDGVTGTYLTPALSIDEIAQLAQGASPANLDALRVRSAQQEKTYGVPWDVDANNLAESGWGVVFPHDASPDIASALTPLLNLRAEQAASLFKQFSGPAGYRPGETARGWLGRQGAGPGQPQVKKVPYYLLIVGGPQRVPFRFQFELAVNYAVGRIDFETLDEYASYARTVEASESPSRALPRTTCFFGAQNSEDKATTLSASQLVEPLAKAIDAKFGSAGWKVETLLASDASKANLGNLLNGPDPPAFLFTATHGMAFPHGHALQARHQGALLCQDWPGPLEHSGPIPTDYYFAADDLSAGASLNGLIAFHFACYGAGTPRLDDYAHRGGVRREIAPAAFLADLPRRMLGKAGAIASVGHVERAWGYSFMWPGVGQQTSAFETCISALISGSRIGAAMEPFAMRLADLAVNLNGQLEDLKFGAVADPLALADLWTANNDARSYVVLGDPAVKARS